MCDHEPKYAKGLCRSCYAKDQHKKHYQSQKKSTSLVDVIKEDFEAGVPIAVIAEKHDKTESAVWVAAKRAGWDRQKPSKTYPEEVELTSKQLAERLGIKHRTIISYRSWYEDSELCDRLQSLDPEGVRWEPVANDNYTYGWKKTNA